MEQALVSIIIPAFNYGRYIKLAIESCLMQKDEHIDIEIIVIDDGSTDNTFYEIKPYILNRSIRYERTENLGVAHARNLGIELSKGDYIIFLDADDYLAKDSVKSQLLNIDKNKQNAMTICQSIEVHESSTKQVFIRPLFKDSIEAHICYNNVAPIHSFLVTKDLIKTCKFKSSLLIPEDYEYWLRCLQNKCDIKINPHGFVIYQNHGGSRSKIEKDIHDINIEMFTALENYIKTIEDEKTLKKAKIAIAARYMKECANNSLYVENAMQHIDSIESLDDDLELYYFLLLLIHKHRNHINAKIKNLECSNLPNLFTMDFAELRKYSQIILQRLCIDDVFISRISDIVREGKIFQVGG